MTNIDKPLVLIVYSAFLFMVALATMIRGEREFIRKEKAKSARRHQRNLR